MILVRGSGTRDGDEARASIMEGLCEQGYQELDIDDLRQLEIERGTELGRDLQDNRKANLEIALLKQVIFSGSS